MNVRTRWLRAALTVLTIAAPAIVTTAGKPPIARAVAPDGASAYTAVAPTRILDTRIGTGIAARMTAGQTSTLQVAGRAGVPAGASAVVINLGVTDPGGPGFVTMWPAGLAQPTASVINDNQAGQSIANLVTVQLSATGALSVFTNVAANLVGDVQGYYLPIASATAGRFVNLALRRILDTRDTKTPLAAGATTTVDIAALGGIPVDAVAAVLKVTVTETGGAGYFTVYPAGSPLPTASNLNVIGVNDTATNQVIARLTNGKMTVFGLSGGQVIIDISGYFTGASAPPDQAGLFVAVAPGRLIDTRQDGVTPSKRRVIEVAAAGQQGVPPAGVGAIVANFTATNTVAPGFLTAWPARQYRPLASSVNITSSGQTVANHIITQLSAGSIDVFTLSGGDMLVDVAGWFIGTDLAPFTPAATPRRGPTGPAADTNYRLFNPVTRWNPCRALRYQINLGGYGEQYRPLVEDAMDRVASATGLDLVYVGDTGFVATSGSPYDSSAAELTLTLANAGMTDVIGGGTIGITFTRYTFSPGGAQMISASVTIDMDIANNPDWSPFGIGPVILHELGHAMGLDHLDDRNQLMYPTNGGVTSYGTGDQRGLYLLGAAGGCSGLRFSTDIRSVAHT